MSGWVCILVLGDCLLHDSRVLEKHIAGMLCSEKQSEAGELLMIG